MRHRAIPRPRPMMDNPATQPAPALLRTATLADAPAIDQIEQLSFTHSGERFGPKKVRYLIETPRAVAIVAEDRSQIIGWAVGFTSFGRAQPWGRIYGLAVHPNARGRRIGPKLMRELMHRLRSRGAQQVYLEVRPDNPAAVRLYESFGFRFCKPLESYYAPGIHAHRMVSSDSVTDGD